MNKRMVMTGAISLLMGIFLFAIGIPIAIDAQGKTATSEVIFILNLYTFMGFGIALAGVIILIAGLMKKPDR